ncbi:MAG: hypothetical protein ACREO4_13065 [Lysobacter sp.]
MKKTAEDVGKVVGTAIAGGVAVASAALISWTREINELSEQTRILSDLSGTSSTVFQQWAVGARSVGIEQDKLSDILKDTRERIGEFVRSGGGEMADFFENIAPKVGVTADQFARLSGPEAMQLYVDSLEKAGVGQNEMVAYMEAMASDSTKLIPLLADGGREMRAWGDAAEKAGAIMSDQMIVAMKDSQEQIDKLKLSYLGVKIEVVEGITPAIEKFAALLNDAETREGLATVANGLVTITTKAIEAAAAIGKLGGQYMDFLSDRGFLKTGDDSTMAQLEARRSKLQGALGKTDGYIGRLLYGDKTADELRKELAEVEADIAGFPFRGVTSTSTTTAGSPKPSSGGNPPRPAGTTSRTKATKELTEAEKLYQEVMEVNAEIDQMAAEHQTELVIAEGNRVLAKHKAIEATDEFIKQLEWENSLIGATNIELETEAALRYAGADATEEQRQSIADLIAERELDREAMAAQVEMMDAARDSARGFFADLYEGVGAWDALKDAAGRFADKLYEMATDQLIDQILGKKGDSGGGAYGDALGSIFGALFGGARAGGGPVDAGKAYLVGENGPEMVVPRASGTVVPAMQTASLMGGGGGFNQTLQFALAAPTDPRTQQQIAQRVGFETQRASNRNR